MKPSKSKDIARLTREHGPFMERLAAALTAISADADDLVQDTWIEAMEHGVETMRSERGWLVTAMRRRAGALRRKLRPKIGFPAEAEADLRVADTELPPAVAARMEAEQLIGDALGQLSEPYRSALYLRYRLEWTPTKIAAETKTPVKTVKTRLSRGLELLRRDLKDELESDRTRRPRDQWMALFARLAKTIAMKKTLLSVLLLVAASVGWLGLREAALSPTPPQLDASVAVTMASDGPNSSSPTAPEAPAPPPLQRQAASPIDPRPVTNETTSLFVQVIDAEGEPATSGEVIATRTTGDGSRSQHLVEALSDDGFARFTGLEPGHYEVKEYRIMAFARTDVVAGAESTLKLQGKSDGLVRVSGTVVDPDGHPVKGATLWSQNWRGPQLAVGETNQEGKFKLQSMEWSSLQASVPGRLPSGSVYVSRLEGDSQTGRHCVFTLGAHAARLSGRVMGLHGEGIGGALVTAGSLQRRSSQFDIFDTPHPVTAITDQDGRFEYGQALPEGTWRIGVMAPDGRGLVRRIDVGSSDLEIELTVEPGATIEGLVRGVDGQPATAGTVWILPLRSEATKDSASVGILGVEHSAVVDDSGHYRLNGVLGHEFDLMAEAVVDGERTTARVEVPPLRPGEAARIDLQLSDGPVIAGIVVDDAGLPIEGVVIDAKQEYGTQHRAFIVTDAAGKFRVTSIVPRPSGSDKWTIKVMAAGGGIAELLGVADDVSLGTEDVKIIARRPTLKDAFVNGRVLFEGSELSANVEILIWPVHDPEPKIRSGYRIDVDRSTGGFHYGPVAAGTYRLTAMQTDRVLGTVENVVVGAGETIVAPDLVID